MKSVALRYDVGPRIGLGHRRRMEALALELGERGHRVDLADATTDVGVGCDALVVDSYQIRADEVRTTAELTAAVDDLRRDLAVDLLIDPSPGARPDDHPAARSRLLGTRYALLPRSADTRTRPVGPAAHRVLVSTGAADESGVGSEIAGAVATLVPSAQVRLVIGPWGATHTPSRVEGLVGLDDLGPVLADADIVVSAGGVTLMESLRLGRPTVAVATADNQVEAVAGAARAGAVVEATPETAARVVAALVEDLRARESLSIAASSHVDGYGAARVADAINAL